MERTIKLNLGCGDQIVEDWINVDYSLGARLAKIPFFKAINGKVGFFNLDWDERIFLHDLTKRFPWDDQSVDEVYSSHTLEHLSKAEGRDFLRECHRVLKKNSVLRIVVPDLKSFVDSYLNAEMSADDFVQNLGVLYGTRNQSNLKQKLAPFYQFPHKCMYDTPTLVRIMTEIGFEATAKKPFQSDITSITTIERDDRTRSAVIVEGRKL